LSLLFVVDTDRFIECLIECLVECLLREVFSGASEKEFAIVTDGLSLGVSHDLHKTSGNELL
jgi:hypothetical protein